MKRLKTGLWELLSVLKKATNQIKSMKVQIRRLREKMFTKRMRNRKKMSILLMFLKIVSTSAGSVGVQKKKEMRTMSKRMSLIH